MMAGSSIRYLLKKGKKKIYPFHVYHFHHQHTHHVYRVNLITFVKPTNTLMQPSDQPPPPTNTTAMATMRDGTQPRTSIANLILPPADMSAENLLSLSNLAASMTPAAPSDRRCNFNRTKSTPAIRKHHTLPSEHLPDDTRRNHRMSRTTSVAAPLGVAHTSTKRLSRRGSGLSLSNAARNAIATSTSGLASADSSSDPPRTPRAPAVVSNPIPSPVPSPAVLRPINSNPITGYHSKQTSQSNSVESCIPPASPIKSEAFHTVAARFQTGFAANALASMRGDPMDCDDADQREPSSSSHDAKIAPRSGRSRTTPDAKRAQNRESAKRFRVAQKKRWAELQETVEKKDQEIEKLKCMLQEVTNNTLAKRGDEIRPLVASVPKSGDPLGAAELNLFVRLMMSPKEEHKTENESARLAVPLAASIGALYRVLVCKVDGAVLGVRHQMNSGMEAMGGGVGSLVWEHVEPCGVPHLRFSIVHAPHMEKYTGDEPQVFAYRRRERSNRQPDGWIRMKGCVYPTKNESGDVTGVLLAEFIEL